MPYALFLGKSMFCVVSSPKLPLSIITRLCKSISRSRCCPKICNRISQSSQIMDSIPTASNFFELFHCSLEIFSHCSFRVWHSVRSRCCSARSCFASPERFRSIFAGNANCLHDRVENLQFCSFLKNGMEKRKKRVVATRGPKFSQIFAESDKSRRKNRLF